MKEKKMNNERKYLTKNEAIDILKLLKYIKKRLESIINDGGKEYVKK